MEDGQAFNPFQLFTGIFIPEWLARSREVSAGAKLAYGRLARYAGQNGLSYPSVETLGMEIGYDIRQTRRYLVELEEVGLIRRVARVSELGQTSNLFEFLWRSRFMSGDPRSDLTAPPRSDLTAKESHIEESHFETHTKAVRVTPSRASDLSGQTSLRFEEFWGKYPRKQRKDSACSQYISLVTVESEGEVFACLGRYLASDEVARGIVMNPDNWLYHQHRNGWEGDWPRRESKDLSDKMQSAIMRNLKDFGRI